LECVVTAWAQWKIYWVVISQDVRRWVTDGTVGISRKIDYINNISDSRSTKPINQHMCTINWLFLLEYFKVLLSWPPIALVIAIIAIVRFNNSIQGLLNRINEGSFMGGSFKATPQADQQFSESVNSKNDLGLGAISANESHAIYSEHGKLPPELIGDPLAIKAIQFVKDNPIQTVVEYKNLSKFYGFERTFNLIYGTQISLLDMLSKTPDKVFNQAELMTFYYLHQGLANNPKYLIEDFFNFPVKFGLLNAFGPPDSRSFQITYLGQDFLSYIKSNYQLIWNTRAF